MQGAMGKKGWLIGRVGGTGPAVGWMVSNDLAHGRHALCLNEMERSQSKSYIWQRSVSAVAVAEYWVGRGDE